MKKLYYYRGCIKINKLITVLFIIFFSSISYAEDYICSVGNYQHERSMKCVNFLADEINKYLIEYEYPKDRVKIIFDTEDQTKAVREIMERLYGITLEENNGTYKVIILGPMNDNYDVPVELIILHELIHVYQMHNNTDNDLKRDEQEAMWLSEIIYLNLLNKGKLKLVIGK